MSLIRNLMIYLGPLYGGGGYHSWDISAAEMVHFQKADKLPATRDRNIDLY